MAVITGATNPELFPIYYERKLLQYVKQNLPVLDYGQKFSLPRNSGKKAVFTRFAPLPVVETPITNQPTPGTSANMSTEQVEAQVEEYANYYDLDEFADLTSFVPLLDRAIDNLAYNAKQSLHKITMNELASGTNVIYAGGVTSRSALDGTKPLTLTEIRKAATLLKRRDIPTFEDGKYVCFIHPDKTEQLFSNQDLITLSITKRDAIGQGYLGEISGIKIIETTAMPIIPNGNTNSPADVYQTIIVGANAYGIVDLDGNTIQTVYSNLDKLGRVKTVGWKAYFAAKRLYEPAIVRIESN
jgi:N4-gp56 family major capsid protein